MICANSTCLQEFEPRKGSGGLPQKFCSLRCARFVTHKHYVERHPDRGAASSRKYYWLNRRLSIDRVTSWRKLHPESGRLAARKSMHKRRALKRDTDFSLTASEWIALLVAWGYRCAYCRRSLTNPTQDHFIPLSKSGTHTMDNVVPACLSCNSKKGNRDVGVFLYEAGL